jgi:hypothetical protein
MAFKKGSKEAKDYMSKVRASKVSGVKKKKAVLKKKAIAKKKIAPKKVVAKKTALAKSKVVKQKGTSNKKYDKMRQALPPGIRISKATGKPYKEVRANRSDKGVLLGLGSIFDVKIIQDLDSLKKQYLKLAKKYHPDAGGTTIQFQELQNEYERLFKKLLNGSGLSEEAKENEVEIDKEIRNIIDALVNLENLNVELIGKWLWISGETYPVKDVLKSAGLQFIKKAGVPYWVYKGSESAGRGKMSMEEIKNKYGSSKIDLKKTKKISGVKPINKTKLKSALLKLKKGLNKRMI